MPNDDPPSHTPQAPTLQPTNALAGPSSVPKHYVPPVYLPDPVPERRKPWFTSQDDLVKRFQLLPTYDRYVRPYAPVYSGAQGPTAEAVTDKGKGKERERAPSTPSVVQTPGAAHEEGEEEAQVKGEKKWKNNYKHLIKDIPGKHSTKKDNYLMEMMQVPPKQRVEIKPFDLRTQREAFAVSLEGLKGWNINVLVAESPQAREDRKRRKELKKLAKAQAQAAAQGQASPSISAASPSALPVTPAPSTGTPRPARTSTPKPSIAANRPSISQTQARGRTPAGGTARSVTTPAIGGPGSGSAGAQGVSTSASAPSQLHQVSTPASTPNAGPGPSSSSSSKRGVKREREDSSNRPSPGVSASKAGAGTKGGQATAVVNAKAGVNGVRPRKKQRTATQDFQGKALAVQQPTPRS